MENNKEQKLFTYSSYITISFWSGTKNYLKSLAKTCNVDIVISEKKHILTTIYHFEVKGRRKGVELFESEIEKLKNR